VPETPFILLDSNGQVYQNTRQISTVEKAKRVSSSFYLGESGAVYCIYTHKKVLDNVIEIASASSKMCLCLRKSGHLYQIN
jgi:alpha-tubulin suppressor-like RCC1 family protein